MKLILAFWQLIAPIWKYIAAFLIAMVPIIELRGAIPFATAWGIDPWVALLICTVGNMIPVPIIYFFARKVLLWGKDKRFIGKIFRFFLEKGEKAGQKLASKAGRGGLFVSLMLFVAIPIPGTGAWTGTLGASFLNMGFKSTVASVSLGVLIAGIIMAVTSMGALTVLSSLLGF